ncbi:hypothetical protein [Nostoc sp. PCC 7524]|nr:hypothetical protein [Nostoc sp. PCC 7524]
MNVFFIESPVDSLTDSYTWLIQLGDALMISLSPENSMMLVVINN